MTVVGVRRVVHLKIKHEFSFSRYPKHSWCWTYNSSFTLGFTKAFFTPINSPFYPKLVEKAKQNQIAVYSETSKNISWKSTLEVCKKSFASNLALDLKAFLLLSFLVSNTHLVLTFLRLCGSATSFHVLKLLKAENSVCRASAHSSEFILLIASWYVLSTF